VIVPVVGHGDAIKQAEVDHVIAELGVDHVTHGLLDVSTRGLGALVGNYGPCRSSHTLSLGQNRWPGRSVFIAIQESNAHLTRAGNRETPAKATASSEHVLVRFDWPWTASSPGSLGQRQRFGHVRPMTRSVITDVLA